MSSAEAREIAARPSLQANSALTAARVLEADSALPEALSLLNRIVSQSPDKPSAAEALFLTARCQLRAENNRSARLAVERLRTLHPDSSYLPRALWMLSGATTGTREHRAWVEEQAAARDYDHALQMDKDGQTTAALEKARSIIAQYPKTSARWRAQETAAHLLVKAGKTDEASDHFAEIVSTLGQGAPKSRIVATSLRRMGALKQRNSEHQAAYEFYMAASEASATSETASDNLLQAAGAFFEIAQHQDYGAQKQTPETWRSVKSVLRAARDAAVTSDIESIADLMQTEVLYWSHDYKATVTSATQFRALYTPDRFHRVHWTLAYFQACALENLRQYGEAAKLFAEFMVAVDNKALWPKQDHHVRAAYRRLTCLEAAKAPSDQTAAARSFLLANYPGTVWAQRVLEKEDGKPWERPRTTSGATE